MNASLTIVHCDAPIERIVAVQSFATFFGIETRVKNLREPECLADLLPCEAAIVDVTSIATNLRAADAELLAPLEDARTLLLLVSDASAQSQNLLHRYSGARVERIVAIPIAGMLSFSQNRDLCHELTSQSLPRRRSAALNLGLAAGTDAIPLMNIGPEASLVSWGSEKRRFAWSTYELSSLNAPVFRELDVELSLDQILPAFIFIRQAFGDRCWQNPTSAAAFVIDDPPLKPKYGHIHFDELLSCAESNSFRITLAFIPWNTWRARISAANNFRHHGNAFGLCIHGCDHTDKEYGAADYALLFYKNRIALQRMNQLTERTGLKYDHVMVCPQEHCSLEGWRALADTDDIVAMVNSSCIARHNGNQDVVASDLLLPAHDALYGFPIFKRYYSESIAPFALALFLGRPAIMAAHEGFFRDGVQGVVNFTSNLRRISPRVSWKSLEEIALSTHLTRRASTRVREVRFFTRRFLFTPSPDFDSDYRFIKRVPATKSVTNVLVNGRPVSFSRDTSNIYFELVAPKFRQHNIELQFEQAEPKKAFTFGAAYHLGVAVRRFLSEARDQHLFSVPFTRIG